MVLNPVLSFALAALAGAAWAETGAASNTAPATTSLLAGEYKNYLLYPRVSEPDPPLATTSRRTLGNLRQKCQHFGNDPLILGRETAQSVKLMTTTRGSAAPDDRRRGGRRAPALSAEGASASPAAEGPAWTCRSCRPAAPGGSHGRTWRRCRRPNVRPGGRACRSGSGG